MKAQIVQNAHRAVIKKHVDQFQTALASAPAEIRTGVAHAGKRRDEAARSSR